MWGADVEQEVKHVHTRELLANVRMLWHALITLLRGRWVRYLGWRPQSMAMATGVVMVIVSMVIVAMMTWVAKGGNVLLVADHVGVTCCLQVVRIMLQERGIL